MLLATDVAVLSALHDARGLCNAAAEAAARLSFILVLPSVRGLAALTVFNGDLAGVCGVGAVPVRDG